MHPHDAQELARELMRRHGLFDAGWRFRFDHARRRFGCCHYRPKAISLSRPLTLLNGEAEVRDTLLHEIAHALCPGDGHGRRWRATCRELGAKPRRCYSDDMVASPPRRPAPYEWGCGSCDWWVERRRRTRGTFLCARCRGKLLYRVRRAARGMTNDQIPNPNDQSMTNAQNQMTNERGSDPIDIPTSAARRDLGQH